MSHQFFARTDASRLLHWWTVEEGLGHPTCGLVPDRPYWTLPALDGLAALNEPVEAFCPTCLEMGAPRRPEPTQPVAPEWQYVDGHATDWSLRRLEVPGGWLVQSCSYALAFVPDPDHEWRP